MRAKSYSLTVVSIVLISTLCATLTTVPEIAEATTHYVGGIGPGNYTRIQDAIDNASDGDTVYVFSGTYQENVIVNKTLNLTGEDKGTTIIDGGGIGVVVNVTSDWVNVTGFTATNSGPDFYDAGIGLNQVHYCRVHDNNLPNNFAGVTLYFSSNSTITNNTASGNPLGDVFLETSTNNIIANNTLDTARIFLYRNSDNNIIIKNTMVSNWGDIILDFSDNNMIANNTILGGSGLDVFHSNNNTISNNTIEGTTWGMNLIGSHNSTIAGNSISETLCGVYLQNSNQNAITDNVILNNTQGMFLERSDNGTVANNVVTTGGILLDYSNNATMVNNTISLSDLPILLQYSNEATISNNRISNNLYGLILESSDNNTLANNRIESTVWDGITLIMSDNNVLGDNILSSNWIGIHLINFASGNVVENNTISSIGVIGILIQSSRNDVFLNNTMFEGGFLIYGDSIDLWNTHTIDTTNYINGRPVYYCKNITGGTVPSGAGQVILANCSNVLVEKQNLSKASVGIQLGFSSNNTIFDNDVSNNSQYGIYFKSSDNNTIADNEVQYSGYYGAYMESSIDNTIFHNNFIANAGQAYDNSGANRWYDWYPSGGNYWSDYVGPDLLSGSNQDEPGSDGIGDWPHPIDGGASDTYPLLSPLKLTHPLPPTILGASLSGPRFENVSITWSLSLDDGMGLQSVVRYDVFRNMSFDPDGLGYQLMASLPNRTSEYVDVMAGERNPNNYFYRICAVGLSNNTSCSIGQASKYTRPLSEGVNLISVPLVQSNESLQTVLQTVSYDNVWSYDPINQEWKSVMKSKPHGGTLQHLNLTMALWINVTEKSNLTVAGIVPMLTVLQLWPGWNLVGFPSFNSTYAVGNLKAETGTTRVEAFDQLNPPYFLKSLADGDTLQTGYGCWIRMGTAVSWTVYNT
jgi:parallel beta-helix repeat protein